MTAGAAVVETKAPSVAVERTKDGTLYWTLSIYFEANAVEACAKKRLSSDIFRQAQLKHPPSLTLRNAIDPLFNDIAESRAAARREANPTLSAIATAIGITSGLALFFNVADFVERLGEGAKLWAFFLRLSATVLAVFGALWVLRIGIKWAWHKLR